jgi:2',3'-cyclic-nucleotide 2'-phosphodiesterase (5'-nucleotidase family)
VDLVFDTDKGRVIKRQSNTLLMDEHVLLDDRVLKLASAEIDRAQKVSSANIGEATEDFWVRTASKKETPIHELVFAAIADALHEHGAKVDAIVHGIIENRYGLRKGAITVGDVWKVVPYENTVGVVQLTPSELREVLEEDLDAYHKNAFRGIWGLKWAFNPEARKGARTITLRRADGLPLDEKQRLAVAFNSYDLAGGGQRWKRLRELADRPESQLVEYDFQTREAVINYVRNHTTISPTIDDWWTAKRSAGNGQSSAGP